MKFSSVTLVLTAGLGISQVSAAPLRVVVVSEHFSGSGGSGGFVRVGHINNDNAHLIPNNVATFHAAAKLHKKPKHGCAGSLRAKTLQLSNWFRHVLGMPSHVAHPGAAHAVGVPDGLMHFSPVGSPSVHGMEARPLDHTRVHHDRPHDAHGHHHHAHHHHHARPHTFVQRITHALMVLGPWEGRAVSFIIGCGIGVLIRMFWVLAVLAVRSLRRKKVEEEFLGDEVVFEEEAHLLAPPLYVEEYVPAGEAKEKKEEKAAA